MPFRHVFHKRYTQAFCAMGDDEVWFFVVEINIFECFDDVVDVVTIHVYDIPAEGSPSLTDIFQRHDIFR